MAKRQHIDNYLGGLQDAVDNLQAAVDKIKSGSAQGLADALIFIGTESQKKAPVETGDLRGSLEIEMNGTVIGKGNSGGGVEVISAPLENSISGKVSYNTPYAAAQHEHTEYDHPHGGQAKYLESVATGEQDRILKLIAGGIVNSLEEL